MNVARKLTYIVPLLIIVAGILVTPSYGKWVWNKEMGWIEPPAEEITTQEQRYRYAVSLLVEQKYMTAIKEFEAIIKSDPDSEYAEVSQINIGRAHFLNGNYKRALKAYDKVLQKYPGTRRVPEILESKFQLGIAQMEKNKRAAINIFEKIIAKHPLGPLAADANIKIADSYFELGRYEEALDTYERFLENYPRSEWVPYVLFRIPISKLSHERRQERNTGLLASAQEDLEVYLASYPYGVYAEDAKRMIEEIRIMKAEREFRIGEFYLRVKKPISAAMYFEFVKNDFPGTVWEEKASDRLRFLRMIGAIK
ncbi:MAG: outer membrane protein assembly factor BamD [Candidatus Loosdrechtia sp.]|uniref:outer membrane protein assembly factor BamD n=1 Tax=Candidatus Loosdrechtia sp. TaxID=3101272 RepID=UPI003A687E1D|nr:MAG: outer membrane protein assembly factor BamD [Candidatus Jettenia sp. AMX2]